MNTNQNLLAYFAKNIYILVGLVLVWRGIWYLIDALDIYLFGRSHTITTIAGIILGLVILYIPDHDLKEIQKL